MELEHNIDLMLKFNFFKWFYQLSMIWAVPQTKNYSLSQQWNAVVFVLCELLREMFHIIFSCKFYIL